MLRSSLQVRIVDNLLEHVAAQGLTPGAHLNLDSFARQIGVSRSPVHAAFIYLAQKGVLEARHNRGFFVKQIDAQTARQAPGFRLYDRIIDDMARGTLAGSLSESALMRRYGVDRRELGLALRRLSREGLAMPSLSRGWLFVEFSLEIMLQGYQLRRILEPQYILDPAFEPDRPRLEALRRDHEKLLERLSPETPFEETFGLDARFHQALAEFTRNRFFIETIRTQTNIRRLSEYLGRRRLQNVRISMIDHVDIITALLGDEREWASALMRRHLSQSTGRVARYYQGDIDDIRRKQPAEDGGSASGGKRNRQKVGLAAQPMSFRTIGRPS